MIEKGNSQFESHESNQFGAELQELFDEVTRQIEEIQPQDSELADHLYQAVDELKQLNIEAAKTALGNLDLPELMQEQLGAIEQLLENKLAALEVKVDNTIPGYEASQQARDVYVETQAAAAKQEIEQAQIDTLQSDMADPENYPKDPLSRGAYLVLRWISKLLKETTI